MRKFKYLFIELYGFNLYYVRCEYKSFLGMVRREFGREPYNSDPSDGKFQVYQKGTQNIGVIYMSNRGTIPQLAHECLHATHFILQERGMVLHDTSEEAYCYLLEYILKNTKSIIKA